MNMNIQTSNSVSVMSTALRTTLASITKDVADLPERLTADLISAGIVPTGPMMFLYDGVTPDPQNEFDLRIVLPVSTDDVARYKGPYKSYRLEPFHFVETVLHGDIEQLGPVAYEPLLANIAKAGMKMTGFSREVYQNFVAPSDDDNETRVQIGVQAE